MNEDKKISLLQSVGVKIFSGYFIMVLVGIGIGIGIKTSTTLTAIAVGIAIILGVIFVVTTLGKNNYTTT